MIGLTRIAAPSAHWASPYGLRHTSNAAQAHSVRARIRQTGAHQCAPDRASDYTLTDIYRHERNLFKNGVRTVTGGGASSRWGFEARTVSVRITLRNLAHALDARRFQTAGHPRSAVMAAGMEVDRVGGEDLPCSGKASRPRCGRRGRRTRW
jgi:hypothetical protein